MSRLCRNWLLKNYNKDSSTSLSKSKWANRQSCKFSNDLAQFLINKLNVTFNFYIILSKNKYSVIILLQSLINEFGNDQCVCPKWSCGWGDFGYLKRSYILGSHQETTQWKSLKTYQEKWIIELSICVKRKFVSLYICLVEVNSLKCMVSPSLPYI